MGRVLRSRRALIDIADIGEYIAAYNVSAARRMLERLDDLFVQLSENSEMGQRRDDLVAGARLFSLGNYVVVFRAHGRC